MDQNIEIAHAIEEVANAETRMHIKLLDEMLEMPETKNMTGRQALRVFKTSLEKLVAKSQ